MGVASLLAKVWRTLAVSQQFSNPQVELIVWVEEDVDSMEEACSRICPSAKHRYTRYMYTSHAK